MDSEPPFEEVYRALLDQSIPQNKTSNGWGSCNPNLIESVKVECELPLIDLSQLRTGKQEQERCKEQIFNASKELGFFQLINHGISSDILEQMRTEQVKTFKQPFQRKICGDNLMNLSASTYRWGTPTATKLDQLSWSEAFHIPMADMMTPASDGTCNSLSSAIVNFSNTVANLAQTLAEILAEKMERNSNIFRENCEPKSCYVRLNRYPPCPFPHEIFGLVPHTDSDFLTILHQDHVGGLQLVRDGMWVAVKSNPKALMVNVGDLLQAWSNNVYKSIEHRVVANPRVERFSAAYFFCPSNDTEIWSASERLTYKKFSFFQYKKQVEEDVKQLGYKIGLQRFLL